MADVELLHPFNRRHRLHVLIGEAMAGIDPQAQAAGHKRALGQACQLARLVAPGGFGVTAGVQLHPAAAAGGTGLELGGIGIDEQADADAGVLQTAHQVLESRQLGGHVEAAFGGDLLAPLRHQGDHVGANGQGDRRHFGGGRHLQVEAAAHGLAQQLDIAVLDVAPVFPQMDGDAVGAPQFGQQGVGDRVRFNRAPRLAHVGDVVDVDAQTGHASAPNVAILWMAPATAKAAGITLKFTFW